LIKSPQFIPNVQLAFQNDIAGDHGGRRDVFIDFRTIFRNVLPVAPVVILKLCGGKKVCKKYDERTKY
jgi:hypothetical protein